MASNTNLSAAQKVAIVRAHLIENVEVSDLCQQHGISVVTFYNWQRQLFENAESCFQRKPNSANVRRQDEAAQRKIAALEEKLQAKNEVISELMEENIKAKKANGEL